MCKNKRIKEENLEKLKKYSWVESGCISLQDGSVWK